ncbi:TIM barrel protein [Sporomusa acidovorans]|uniref:Endonuclease 4 n=1 Tax=Sporomusa acidovorans (strain ATCC 49682 / DSM 3132 / Mol) TaxID=1123286 RepID=A0ABZ3J4X3_SPOA4|nr:TIM barrel protein [Sporomusa acidovorans]OZC15516.1 endonuclease 4 [Sporomusa acidovorans DSM 3132]SDE16850.1 deoxyribonuclease-4 [Sporomusa acidovorans]
MFAQFGPAGNPDAFYETGFKASADMPEWLAAQKLTAYEYQCSRGVTIRQLTAELIGQKAELFAIKLSIHAPYYISLATEDETTAANTMRHFLRSLEVAKWMGADRVVFHIGGPGKGADRRQAMERAKRLFVRVLEAADKQGLLGPLLLPETMGKQNQLGSLDEVLEFCQLDKRVRPAVDFGHLHAVTGGLYTTGPEFSAVFEKIGELLGTEAAKNLHIHFSPIEFTRAGEKRHWSFGDPFGPPYEPLVAVIADCGYSPRIICESAGTQAKDAKTMQDYYYGMLKRDF